jgi:hypothetical protein
MKGITQLGKSQLYSSYKIIIIIIIIIFISVIKYKAVGWENSFACGGNKKHIQNFCLTSEVERPCGRQMLKWEK